MRDPRLRAGAGKRARALLRLAEGEASLAALFDGSRHAPAPIVPGEPVAAGGLAPHWLSERLAASGVEARKRCWPARRWM
jgi:16S rRNA (cytosine967-C5)-methyltransferase